MQWRDQAECERLLQESTRECEKYAIFLLSFRKGCWHWHCQQHTLLNCITFSIVASECVILAMHTAADSREESAHTYTLRAEKISQLSRDRELIYRLSLSLSRRARRSLVARLESDRTQFAEKR
jgi:hypothetical protein